MTTNFFERQETQKTYTLWLVVGFVAAILAVVVVIDLIVIAFLGAKPMYVITQNPKFTAILSLVVLGTILGGAWRWSRQMRAGGIAVAESLGGVAVNSADGDLKLQRLLNVVEEMAIAARIRRPEVFVLPNEPGINAFAAGRSPDEAAIAVTQGALDRLDREQLQAVIGHEFSHILNGDMKINMRMTAWIFGLCVITDLASRAMRGNERSRGNLRFKLMAFFVYLTGSIGMLAGRLLQAGVSRRREHLADASAVQFTRNPQALQSAFVIMAANPRGTQIINASSVGVSHMFIASSDPAWAAKVGGSWLATHPPLEERVRALDSRVTPSRFKSMVNEERRKMAARAKAEATASSEAAESNDAKSTAAPAAVPALAAGVAAAAAASAGTPGGAAGPARLESLSGIREISLAATFQAPALTETLPTGVRMVAGILLPPDPLRNRLDAGQQEAVKRHLAAVESQSLAVQGTFIAAMLASEPAKWRMQLTKLAPVLGIELLKATQEQIPLIAGIAPAGRLALLTDLLGLLEGMEPAHRKRLRGVARAFMPTVASGDMLRYSVTRLLERKLAKTVAEPPPVPLTERAQQIGDLYASLAHCRFGAGKQGQNAYRAGLMGMLPAQQWPAFPEAPLAPNALDAAIAGVAQVHPTGKQSFSEGMARVIAVGGQLTVPQVDLLRGICLLVDCPVPTIPADVVYQSAKQSTEASPAHAAAR